MSNAANAFSSVFMTLPLIAVPCLAVFGLPSIGPASAEAEVDNSVELALHAGSEDASLGTASDAAAFPPIVDLGGSSSAARVESSQSASPAHSDIAPTSGHLGAANSTGGANRALGLDDPTTSPPENPFSHESHTGHASHDHAAPGFETGERQAFDDTRNRKTSSADNVPAWEVTLARLNRLGIQDFHLTNSDVPGQFYFACNMKEAGRNVVRRFEAEAATPAAAAEDVLAQVESCMASR